MPKIGLGIGLASGAESFVKALMQGQQMRQQREQAKNAPILAAAQAFLSDDNIPYSKRIALLNSIPGLVGKKLPAGEQLSDHFPGLNDMMHEQVDTGQTQDQTAGVSLPDDTNPTAIDKTPQSSRKAPVMANFGDLSPNQLKSINAFKLKQQDQASELTQNLALEKQHYELALSAEAKKQAAFGWKPSPTTPIIYSNDGTASSLFINDSGETKIVPLGNYKDMKTTATSSKDTLPAPARAFIADFLTKTNPATGELYTLEEARQAGLDKYSANADAIATGRVQQATGTVPIQPIQAATTNEGIKKANQSELEQDAKINADAVAASDEVQRIQTPLKEARDAYYQLQQQIHPLQDRVSSGDLRPDVTDTDYQTYLSLHNKLMEAQANKEKLEREEREIISKDTTLKAQNLQRQRLRGNKWNNQSSLNEGLVSSGSTSTNQINVSVDEVNKFLKANQKMNLTRAQAQQILLRKKKADAGQ